MNKYYLLVKPTLFTLARFFVSFYVLPASFVIGLWKVNETSKLKYPASVKTQISYDRARLSIVKQGIKNDFIVGAVVYIGISLAYLVVKH
jgi:hypothetical protein